MKIKRQGQKIKDSNVKKADMGTAMLHPELTPNFRENVGPTTVIFKSVLNESDLAKYLHHMRPDLYYWPEKPEFKEIKVARGDYVRLPHSLFQMFSIDGVSEIKLRMRTIEEL